ncbi:hypothetical protein [Deinococcus budaensis]|uniref:Uncharacterized protein n=1 Tax=Deinococcus budaensis TaxID=1665626 RepID=A0A7W8GH78_9DEIO|nr:hypothetical protein [Deinococcus budaensis]MBB5235178.1 hypothetical protein [Deinococcus budaensis]
MRSLATFRALLGRADSSGADADQPTQLHLRLTIPTLPQPAWTGMLTADVGFVPPNVYLKLSELEALATHVSGIAAQTLDPALTFHALLRELPGDFTPRQLAAAPQRAALATTLDRLTVLLDILLDLYQQHTALRRELLALLPS